MNSLGFRMTAFPVASAGAISSDGIIIGKFQGVIIAKTPFGFRNVKTTLPRRSLGMTAVSMRFTSSAAMRRFPTVSSISSTASLRHGLPCSSASSRERSSARSSMMSAAR